MCRTGDENTKIRYVETDSVFASEREVGCRESNEHGGATEVDILGGRHKLAGDVKGRERMSVVSLDESVSFGLCGTVDWPGSSTVHVGKVIGVRITVGFELQYMEDEYKRSGSEIVQKDHTYTIDPVSQADMFVLQLLEVEAVPLTGLRLNVASDDGFEGVDAVLVLIDKERVVVWRLDEGADHDVVCKGALELWGQVDADVAITLHKAGLAGDVADDVQLSRVRDWRWKVDLRLRSMCRLHLHHGDTRLPIDDDVGASAGLDPGDALNNCHAACQIVVLSGGHGTNIGELGCKLARSRTRGSKRSANRSVIDKRSRWNGGWRCGTDNGGSGVDSEHTVLTANGITTRHARVVDVSRSL